MLGGGREGAVQVIKAIHYLAGEAQDSVHGCGSLEGERRDSEGELREEVGRQRGMIRELMEEVGRLKEQQGYMAMQVICPPLQHRQCKKA